MKVTVDVEIGRMVEQVYDLMADSRNEPSWNTQVSQTELASGEPIGQGTRFRTVNRGQSYDAVITAYERPKRLVYRVSGKAMVIDAELLFTAVDENRSALSAHFDMQPRGPMKVMLSLMAPMVRRDFPKQMDRFRAFCESR
jgi:uncharacterized protein YndB with AHSA1/START domain